MRILITGGAGFIGSNLARRLLRDGVDEVVIIDDFSTGRRENLRGLDIELFEGSILDPTVLEAATASADAIVHLAARPSVPRSIQNPLASHHANATGTLHVLEAAREAGAHVTVASSSSVYGANPALPRHEGLRAIPISPYAVSKLATESYALAHQSVYGVPVLPFRFFNVYGPLQAAGHAYAAVIPSFIDAALRNAPLVVNGDGTQTRDFTYIDTVTEALATVSRNRITSDSPVNLAFGTRNSLLDVIGILEDVLGRSLTVEFRGARPGDVKDSQASSARLRQILPALQPSSLHDGIHQTVRWFQAEMGID